MKHKTKDGTLIELSQLRDYHLMNIIGVHKRKAREGLVSRRGGGSCPDDFWYEEITLIGDDVFKKLRTQEYINEAKRRGLMS